MFEKLQERLEATFKKIRGYGKVTEDNIKNSLREVRIALLEADVNYKVVKDSRKKSKKRLSARAFLPVLHQVSFFVKIVHDSSAAS